MEFFKLLVDLVRFFTASTLQLYFTMKPNAFVLFLMCFLVLTVHAQERERMKEFVLGKPQMVVPNSLYNNLEVIDQRKEGNLMGRVDYNVIAKPAMSVQLKSYLKAVTSERTQAGSLVLCLKRFQFSQLSGVLNTQRFCRINADLYEKDDTVYRHIQTLDQSFFLIGSGKQIMQTGDSAITSLISNNLVRHGNQSVGLTYREMVASDSIAKRQLKLYNTTEYVNGVYSNFESFKNQCPDMQATITTKKGKIRSVVTTNSQGSAKRLFPTDVYALVVDGQPFISTGIGYFPLSFDDDEFLFTGDFQVPLRSGVIVLVGLVGASMLSNAKDIGEFDAMINYKNGELIRLRRLDTLQETINR